MSTSTIPETFGNYALRDFAEVVLPDPVSWIPQTTGWLVLCCVLVAIALHRAFLHLRRWHANKYRREAQRRLTQLELNWAHGNFLSELNKLLKLTAMTAYSREEVAALWGNEWADFLNAQCSEPPFTTQQRELLAQSTYALMGTDKTSSEDVTQALVNAARVWVETHRGKQHI